MGRMCWEQKIGIILGIATGLAIVVTVYYLSSHYPAPGYVYFAVGMGLGVLFTRLGCPK
jgi:hypothetical protein